MSFGLHLAGWKLRLVIALAVVSFLLIFRPFGLTASGLPNIIVLLGLVPLNFLVLELLHRLRVPGRAFVAVTTLAVANTAYLSLFGDDLVDLSLKVFAVTLLLAGAIGLAVNAARWRNEILLLRREYAPPSKALVFCEGEGARQLHLDSAALLFARAEGNYVCLSWRQDGQVRERLLRTTLKQVQDEARGTLIACHRSYLANLESALELRLQRSGGEIDFGDGTSVPVSRSRLDAIRAAAQTV